MRRDVDLLRRVLLDVEVRGSECLVSALLSDATEEAQEPVRYHVRLLIDAGLLKELDRKTAATVRLTNAGHEMIDLARSDALWHEAKACVRDSTGGLSLTVIRAVLTKWAVESAARVERRPRRRVYRSVYAPYERARRGYYDDRDSVLYDDRATYVRTWPDYRERCDDATRFAWRDAQDHDDYFRYTDSYEAPSEGDAPSVGVSLPVHMV